MRNLLTAGLLALLSALLITSVYRPQPLEAQLLHLQVERTLPAYADDLQHEPAELQALFLMYAEDPVLLAKARLMLLRYPDKARAILPLYGESIEFRNVLRTYGEDVALPIYYFLTNEIFTLELMRGLSDAARSALEAWRSLRGLEPQPGTGEEGGLDSEQRGWYAIQFLETEGYGFLGQFVMAPDGAVRWIQTERVLEGINSFFASGLRGLEMRIRREEPLALGDVGWAAVDVAIGVSAFKLLRMGRAAAAGRGAAGVQPMTFSQRSAALGSGLWRGSAIGTRLVKYGAPAVLAYIAVRHPSVIHSLLASVADKLGLPPALVQVVGWTLLLTPVIMLLRFLLGPLAWVIAVLVRLLRGTDRMLRSRKSQVSSSEV